MEIMVWLQRSTDCLEEGKGGEKKQKNEALVCEAHCSLKGW